MLYLKSFYWWLAAFWQRYKQLIFLTAIAVITLVFITSKFNIFPKKGKKIAFVGQFTLNQLPLPIASKLSYGLTRQENNQVMPGIARYWKISDGGKTFTFYLNSNLFWHDGSKVKTSDLHLKIRQAQIIDKDDKTLVIKLKDPFVPLPSYLTVPLFKKGLIGVGSYKLANFKLNPDKSVKYITLEQVGQPLNFLEERITYITFSSYEQAKTAFLMGEVDVLPNLLSVDEFKNYPNVQVISHVEKDKILTLFLNLDNDYLKSKTFRQALAYATPKFENYPRAISSIAKDSPFYNPDVKRFDYNLEEAKKLFAKSKLATQEGTIKLNLITPPQFLNQAEKIKESWQLINDRLIVKVHVNYLPNPNFDALLKIIKIPLDPDQYFLWHSTQPTNVSHLKDAKIDQLIEDGRKEIDPTKRKEIYLNFQKYLVNDVPAIFLYYPITYQVNRTRQLNFKIISKIFQEKFKL